MNITTSSVTDIVIDIALVHSVYYFVLSLLALTLSIIDIATYYASNHFAVPLTPSVETHPLSKMWLGVIAFLSLDPSI